MTMNVPLVLSHLTATHQVFFSLDRIPWKYNSNWCELILKIHYFSCFLSSLWFKNQGYYQEILAGMVVYTL